MNSPDDRLKENIERLKETLAGKKLCQHCFLENHLRAYLEVMADEPDQYIKMSEVYHALRIIIGDE